MPATLLLIALSCLVAPWPSAPTLAPMSAPMLATASVAVSSSLVEPTLAAPPAAATVPTSDRLRQRLAVSALTGTDVAIAVVDVASGVWVHETRADAPMIPASNQKLLTTAAAVLTFGHDHHFATRFLAAARPEGVGSENDGVVEGDLIVRGEGDPCLRADLLAPELIADPGAALAELLVRAGVRRVTGDLVLDAAPFDDQVVHPDWERDDLERSYAAPVGGLSLHGNCVVVEVDGRGVKPSAYLVHPADGYRVRNKLSRHARNTYEPWLMRPDDSRVVHVGGRLGSHVGARHVVVPVRDPVDWFGACLSAACERASVEIDGDVRVEPGAAGDAGTPGGGAGTTGSELIELARFETPLSLAVVVTNKESDNAVADHLFKATGAALLGDGSFGGGGRAVAQVLSERLGVDTSGLVARDGSGLARSNRTTARTLAATLAGMATLPDARARDLYLRTLPIAGLDGSLRDRLDESAYRGRVRAKTGFIRGVYALSGYAWTASGRQLAFAFVFNHRTGSPPRNATMKPHLDDLTRILVDEL